jgi:NAD-dependent dihydropyrimidine dehydrogenase PreA subunit
VHALCHADDSIEWQCPRGVATAAHLRAARRTRRGTPSVRVAERAERETVHRIPGFSEATARAIPAIELWPQLSAGGMTWERAWYSPDDVEVKKIIQVCSHHCTVAKMWLPSVDVEDSAVIQRRSSGACAVCVDDCRAPAGICW